MDPDSRGPCRSVRHNGVERETSAVKGPRGRGGRVTIRTVAERAGRSISTVSAALNGSDGVSEKTRGEILRIAAELGYQADPRAQFLRRSHTGLIGASFAIGQADQGLNLGVTGSTVHTSRSARLLLLFFT